MCYINKEQSLLRELLRMRDMEESETTVKFMGQNWGIKMARRKKRARMLVSNDEMMKRSHFDGLEKESHANLLMLKDPYLHE